MRGRTSSGACRAVRTSFLGVVVTVALGAACDDSGRGDASEVATTRSQATAPSSTASPTTVDTGKGNRIAVLSPGELPVVDVDGPIAVHGPYYACSNDDIPTPPVDCGSTAALIEGRLLVVDDCAYVTNSSGEYVVIFQNGTRWDVETDELVAPNGHRVRSGGEIRFGTFNGVQGGGLYTTDTGLARWLLTDLPARVYDCAKARGAQIWITSNIVGR